MTFMHDVAYVFDKEFAVFEANRMYPLGTRKGSAMTKISMLHHDAIVRAETALIKSYVPTESAPSRRQFDDDLLRIAELKKMIMKMIFVPGFKYGTTDIQS